MSTKLYTIGYATKPIAVFIKQLQENQINAVADIRSVPYSNRFYDYHKEAIAEHLRANGIRYAYLGDELGPRSKDPSHYDDNNQIQFDRLMQADLFKQGIQRLDEGLNKGFRIALMCAEKDAATCHRSLLVGYFLQRNSDWLVCHISHEGDIETQTDLEERLCTLHNLGDDLFADEDEIARQAYQRQLRKTSYIKPQDEPA